MRIGVPKERKTLEKRIALTPDGASELVKHGHQILVETKAGEGSHFSDQAYKEAGATIVPTLSDVWTKSELIVKVKEPHEEEYKFFRPDVAIFDYLHLASMPELTKEMVKGKITGIAYELVQTPDRRLPLLEPMSEVAGKLSVLNGSYFLLSQNGGRGVLLGGTVGVRPGNVVIVGAGIAGTCACEVARGMGASVTVLDVSYQKLDSIRRTFGRGVRTIFSTRASLAREIEKADLLIGAVLVPGAAAPKIVDREMIRSMNKGAVFVDISIDQGGCAETIRPTNLDNPVYIEEEVAHYGVCNMPAQTPRTSTMALTAATLPYVLKIADMGVDKALRTAPEIRNALNTYKGHLTNQPVSEAVGVEFTPIDEVLG
ncbi:MAG: alanine dehydrogenase [Proteobacteria bacterium]|nr:MAG: alanine dehydrogenase [Pseudomonadota bacterium]